MKGTRLPATRLERARRAFVYATDIAIAMLAIGLLIRLVLTTTSRGDGNVARAIGAGACVVAVCAFFALQCRAKMGGRPTPVSWLAVAAAVSAGALVLAPRADAGATLLVWTGVLALNVSIRALACWAAVTTVTITAYLHILLSIPYWWVDLFYVALQIGAFCAVTRLWSFLWQVLKEAHQNQEAKTMLAVSEERLRFARDLHDLLGHSLSVITVKSELAAKLVADRPDRAAAEITEVRRLAKEALREVRTTVQGYRALDLAHELASVRAVLEAAGVRCDVSGDGSGLDEQTRTILAWTIREGATNVLKHGAASYCSITIADGRLEMRNDGARPMSNGTGSGLAGVSERVGSVGGTMSSSVESGEYLLHVEVPT